MRDKRNRLHLVHDARIGEERLVVGNQGDAVVGDIPGSHDHEVGPGKGRVEGQRANRAVGDRRPQGDTGETTWDGDVVQVFRTTDNLLRPFAPRHTTANRRHGPCYSRGDVTSSGLRRQEDPARIRSPCARGSGGSPGQPVEHEARQSWTRTATSWQPPRKCPRRTTPSNRRRTARLPHLWRIPPTRRCSTDSRRTRGRPARRSRLGVAYGNAIHIEHEYAQMAAHFRLKGLVPPSSERPPTRWPGLASLPAGSASAPRSTWPASATRASSTPRPT